jgi:hypothetical protein
MRFNSGGRQQLLLPKKTHPTGCVNCCKANHREERDNFSCSAVILPNHGAGVELGRLTFNHS